MMSEGNYNETFMQRAVELSEMAYKTNKGLPVGCVIVKNGQNILPLIFVLISCQSLWGDNDLGDKFSLLEGDRIEDRLVVYCTGRDYGICHAGISIVPVYSRHMEEGHYAEFAESATSNDDFIVVRTVRVKTKKKSYWIVAKRSFEGGVNLDSDSAILANITGPLNKTELIEKLSDLRVDLQID
ncbi:MAG: hypothetical protein QM762_07845 [Chryseolinea sp.]